MSAGCGRILTTCFFIFGAVRAAAEPRVDSFGDPLPDGVKARMGTVRFRHAGGVEFVGYLPDGKTILSIGKDDAVRWWDAESGRQMRCWSAAARLGRAAPSPDRRVVALQLGDDVVLLDAVSGKELWRLETPDARLGGIAFSPDRRLVATCGNNIRLWDAAAGEHVRDLGASDIGLYAAKKFVADTPYPAAAFLPDAKTLISTGTEGVLWWDVETGKILSKAEGSVFGVCAASPDGKRAATAGKNHSLRLWDVEKRAEIGDLFPSASEQEAVALAFSPNGKLLAVGRDDGRIDLYAAADGVLLHRSEAHQCVVSALAFSPNGALLVSGGTDCAVRQWDAASGKEIRPFAGSTGPIRTLAVSPDGKTVASAGADRCIHLWDPGGGERRTLPAAERETVAFLSFSPDGRKLTSVGQGGAHTVAVWDAADDERRNVFSLSQKQYPNAFALSPDGASVAAFGSPDEDRFAVFDAAKGEMASKHEEDGPRRLLQPGAFLDRRTLAVFRHPDGISVKTGSLFLWDTAAVVGESRTVSVDLWSVFWAVAAPDGKIVAAAGPGGVVRLWNASTGELIRELETGPDFVLAAAFSPDGRTLAVSHLDGLVSLWETVCGSRRGVLNGGQGFIDALGFSPDGRRLYTGGHDGTILVWDLPDGRAAGLIPADLDDKTFDQLWDELESGDAEQAYRAVWTLAASPRRSVPFLRTRLHHPTPTPAQVGRWIADLDADDFETRERASAELRWADEAAETVLGAALARKPSPEARRRIEELLEWVRKVHGSGHPAEPRAIRAIESLEDADTPEARDVLAGLSDGPPTSFSLEAKASLERLRRRPK
jgi:WD40 repeat protein